MSDTAKRRPLGQILMDGEIITEEQLNEALNYQAEHGGLLGQVVVGLGYATEDQILPALRDQFGLVMVDLGSMDIGADAIEKVGGDVARSYLAMPFHFEGGVLKLALANPLNHAAVDDLKFMLTPKLHICFAPEAAILAAVEKYYGESSGPTAGQEA